MMRLAAGLSVVYAVGAGLSGPSQPKETHMYTDEERDAIEAQRAATITHHRDNAHAALTSISVEAQRIATALAELSSDHVYDVETVEGGNTAAMNAALVQIDVAVAALTHLIPEVGQW